MSRLDQVPEPIREFNEEFDADPPEEDIIIQAANEQDLACRLETQESDTEPDDDAKPLGYGPRGHGDPLWVGAFERRRVLIDGAGICSLGRWPPWRRPQPSAPKLVRLRQLLIDSINNFEYWIGESARTLFGRLARGGVTDNPFPDSFMRELTDAALAIFQDGVYSGWPRAGDRPQPIKLRLLQAILHEADDPDVAGLDRFSSGVRIGVGVRMPRTPAVYKRKTRWRAHPQADPRDAAALGFEAAWRDNYRPAKIHQAEVKRQLDDHANGAWRSSCPPCRRWPHSPTSASTP